MDDIDTGVDFSAEKTRGFLDEARHTSTLFGDHRTEPWYTILFVLFPVDPTWKGRQLL